MRNAVNNSRWAEVRIITRLMGGIMVLAFIAGIMVDLDHPLAFLLGINEGRFLHPYFAVAGIAFIGAGLILAIACVCRFLFFRLLKKRDL